jgi:hypothetical protein
VLKAGPRSIDVLPIGADNGSAAATGDTITVDISGCGAWTGGECVLDVSYQVVTSGLTHSSSATLHQ